jgi:hypothetical protein
MPSTAYCNKAAKGEQMLPFGYMIGCALILAGACFKLDISSGAKR